MTQARSTTRKIRRDENLPFAVVVGITTLIALCIVGCGCIGACSPVPADAGALVDAGYPGSSWLSDPLSMPAEPTLLTQNFTRAEDCGACHLDQYADWRLSMHSYAMHDPVFRALVQVRQHDLSGTEDAFCVQCHSPIATRGGEITPGFQFDTLSDVALDGVNCETCHKVTQVERPLNAGIVIDEYAGMQGPLVAPETSAYHASVTTHHLGESVFCGACHDVTESNGLELERTYGEWKESPARGDGKTCITCHMPRYEGYAAKDGPHREGLHRHRFVGVDIPLLEGFLSVEEELALSHDVQTLLTDVASLEVHSAEAPTTDDFLDVFVTVRNKNEAHSLPSGSTFIRQMWLEVLATDSSGQVLFRTGDLDDNGDLRDAFSELDPYGDVDLVSFHSTLLDRHGNPVLFTHEAVEHVSRALSPRYERTQTFFVPVHSASTGAIDVSVRLLLRTHPPVLLRTLGLEGYLARTHVYELASQHLTVTIAP